MERWDDALIELDESLPSSLHCAACSVPVRARLGVSGELLGQVREAFIWDAVNGMRAMQQAFVDDYGMDLTGWALIEALDISTDGNTIVGLGVNPNGINQGWVAQLSVD